MRNGRVAALAFTQRDPDPRRGLTWTEDLQVALGYADRVQLVPVRLSGRRTVVVAARGLPAPLYVLPNGGGIGYGEFHLDAASLAWLSAHLPEIDDALTRGSAWVTLWDALLDGEVPPSRVIDLALERPSPRDRRAQRPANALLSAAGVLEIRPRRRARDARAAGRADSPGWPREGRGRRA